MFQIIYPFFFGISVLTVFLWFSLPHKWVYLSVQHGSYYFLFGAFFIWEFFLIQVILSRFIRSIKSHWPAFLLTIFIMGQIFYTSPPRFKILSDETNLVGTSLAMSTTKTAALPLSGLGLDIKTLDYTTTTPQRPLAFPFLLALFHSIFGYNPHNGFVANFILGAMALFTLYLLMTRFVPRHFAIIGMILMASLPIFSFWVTSSGFETMNLFFTLFSLLIFFQFLKTGNNDYANLLIFSLVILAQCRYESILFMSSLLFAAPLLIKTMRWNPYRFVVIFFPLFLLPLLWQRRLLLFLPLLKNENTLQKTDSLFQTHHLFQNIPSNIMTLSGIDPNLGFLPVITTTGIIGTYLMVKHAMTRRHTPFDAAKKRWLLFVISITILLFFLYGSYTWGNFTLSVSNRFAMIFIPFIIIPSTYCCHHMIGKHRDATKLALTLFAVMQYLIYRPIAMDEKIIKSLTLPREYHQVMTYLKKSYDLSSDKLLIITTHPNLYVVQKMGALPFKDANEHINSLHYYRQIYYDHIISIQYHDIDSDQMTKGSQLSKQFNSHKVKTVKVSPKFTIIISDLTFNMNKPMNPSKCKKKEI